MSDFKEKYINPFTDYGFKRLFGEEPNKDLLEMPKFNKEADELETRFEKWLYVIKNLHKLDRVPEKLKEEIFLRLFETAEIAKFSQQEYQEYEDSLKYYRDLKNSLDTAREERSVEIAKKMVKKGMAVTLISDLTGLTQEEVNKLIKTNAGN